MVDLSKYDNRWYSPGRPFWYRTLWFLAGLPLLRSTLLPGSAYRVALLRWFGARVGAGVVIKPGVRVKYPWLLSMGDHVWLGEGCWIDNLVPVAIGSSACISQEAYLCTGNHDWSDPGFGLIVKPISVGAGAWIGARSMVAPGVSFGECAVLASGSVATKDIPPYEIHSGNPATFSRVRILRTPESETRSQ